MDALTRMIVAENNGLLTQGAYEALVEELATLRLEKVREYGESRYEVDDEKFNTVMCFSDIHRKYIRLRHQMVDAPLPNAKEPLRDTLLDLANYALMAVQVLKLEKEEVLKLERFDVQLTDNPKLIRVYIEGEWRTFRQGYNAEPSPYFIEQVAIATRDPERLKEALRLIGLTDWAEDNVVTQGRVWPRDLHSGEERVTTPATLNFNYQLGGFEFELLSYQNDADNWLGEQHTGLSHLGLHVPDIDAAAQILLEAGYKVAQEVRTVSHTNPAIKDSRRYRYMILDTRMDFGFDLKLIQRLPYDPPLLRVRDVS